ncbi:MAG: PTS mannose transporter subunit IID [Cardiobacteriaceae bacterium]|nr:PTS mannose transporter subunit IID [Cardiobacteriaceae bacterium]
MENLAQTPNPSSKIRLTPQDLNACFVRSNFLQGSWNFERMQALGYAFGMVPAIKRLYPEGSEERKQAIKRHLEFYNTQPFMTAPILGVTLAMEEERANGAPIDDGAINGVKIGLMGPLAGVGDPIFWGTARPVLAGIGAGLAQQGMLLGPILFFVLFNAIRLFFRYWGIQYGYKKGLEIVSDMGGGVLKKITEASAILGLFIMGALVNKWTSINIPFVLSEFENQLGEKQITTVQSTLDSLLPGLPALGLTFLCMWLLRKGVSPLMLILGIFALGIIGYVLGILA